MAFFLFLAYFLGGGEGGGGSDKEKSNLRWKISLTK